MKGSRDKVGHKTKKPREIGHPVSTYYGKYRGVVVNNVDPMGQGRIQVQVPNVLDASSSWAVPCLPAGGSPQAQFQPPRVGAGVWVEFEGGDPANPIWAGNMWNAQETRFPGVMLEEVPGRFRPIPGVQTSTEATRERILGVDWPPKTFGVQKIEAPDLNAKANEVPIEPIELPKQDDEGPPDD